MRFAFKLTSEEFFRPSSVPKNFISVSFLKQLRMDKTIFITETLKAKNHLILPTRKYMKKLVTVVFPICSTHVS